MTTKKIQYCKPFILLLLFGLSACRNKEAEPAFTLSKDVIEIPMTYDMERQFYYSDIIVNNDTIEAGIDTGYTITSLQSFPAQVKTILESVVDARDIK